LTQTSYSTIPSVDIELGNQCSDHSDKKMEKLADGLLRGINSYAKKYIHVAPLSSL
jgi:N-acetylmuramoyl-L-alanine amidase